MIECEHGLNVFPTEQVRDNTAASGQYREALKMSDVEFKIQLDQFKGVLIISISGEIKGLSGREFHREIFQRIQEQDVPIVLDLEGLNYINSMGLRSILLVAKRQQENKAKFAVCSLSKPMREVFEITCFDRIMPVLDSRSEAIAAVT